MIKSCVLFAVGLVCTLSLAACAADDSGDPFGSGTFAGQHRDAITYDCQQTIQCKVQRSEPLEGDVQAYCEDATAEVLNTIASKRMSYLVKFNRCASQVVCSYYDCVTSDAPTFGTTHQDKVMQGCQATVECQLATGAFNGDAQMAYETCVLQNIALLDTFNSDQQRSYLERHPGCAGYASCEYVDCFGP